MIIDCPRCTAHAMHPSRENGVLAICAACGYKILDFDEAATRANIRKLDAQLAARPKKAR